MKKFLVLLTACALVAAFTVPAMAKMEWSFYGSSRLFTQVVDDDWEIQTGNPAQQFDDTDFGLGLQGNSRFGAWARSDTIVGRVEFGVGGADSDNNVDTRLLYGIWKLSWANFIIGQTYTPAAAQFLSNQVYQGDIDLLFYGAMYAGRQPQLKFEIPFTNGMFEIAAISPNSPQRWAVGNVVNGNALGSVETDTYMPKFEARLAYKFGPAQFRLGGGWNSYEITGIDVVNVEHERDIDSWFIVGDIMFGMGPFYLNVGGSVAENPAEYGLLGSVRSPAGTQLAATYDATINGVQDVDSWSVVAVAGFKLNDMLSFEAGWGHLEQDVTVAAVNFEDDVDSYYLQAVITPIKGVRIIPEIGVIDYGDLEISNAADVNQGDETYYMIQWRIDF
jgi:hypothetical protein